MSDPHEYQRDRHSGAGNCVCGRPYRDRRHPHVANGYRLTDDGVILCTCLLPCADPIHVEMATFAEVIR